MSKKSIIQREQKKIKLYNKYKKKQKFLKNKIIKEKNYIKRRELYFILQKIPKNSNINRLRNRCFLTGRSRGYNKNFMISRIVLRNKIGAGEIIGINKSSW